MAKVSTDVIQLKNGNHVVGEAVVVKQAGLLALHREELAGRGWTITHVPTGLRACAVRTKAHAEKLLRLLQGLDWDFKTTRSKKVRAAFPKVRQAMKAVTGNPRTIQI